LNKVDEAKVTIQQLTSGQLTK